MSSIVGRRGVNGSDGYTAAKSALIGLSRSIASYYGRYDIRCNSLAIGIIAEGSTKKHLENPQFAQEAHRLGLGKVGTAREVALAALFFVSDDSTFVSGEVLSVDGGAYAAGHISRPDRPDIPGTERKRPLAPPC
jgi:NAD(P)-dependent dehydrogenase (short-subunit alcohol dehydrogenase family)